MERPIETRPLPVSSESWGRLWAERIKCLSGLECAVDEMTFISFEACDPEYNDACNVSVYKKCTSTGEIEYTQSFWEEKTNSLTNHEHLKTPDVAWLIRLSLYILNKKRKYPSYTFSTGALSCPTHCYQFKLETLFYVFNQNNSGGGFSGYHTIIVEARNTTEANRKAKNHGVYFNGVDKDLDCDCCGDRWFHATEYNAFITREGVLKEYEYLKGEGKVLLVDVNGSTMVY